MNPTRADVVAAAHALRGRVHQTPVLTSATLNALLGVELFFKCENLQRSGAFKMRGATNAVRALPDDVRAVATHSSGNHGAALALAAREAGRKAVVVLPRDAHAAKRNAVARYGAEIVPCEPTLAAREETLAEVLANTGATFVHPYDDAHIIAGAGTAALELLEQQPALEQIWVPVGGGGLAAGTVLAAGEAAQVVLAEPALAHDAKDALESGEPKPALPPKTIADGLRTALGQRNFAILRQARPPVWLVSEAGIRYWTALLQAILKVVVEPSAAVAIAAMAENPEATSTNAGKTPKVGVILSGGNVTA